MSGSDPVTGTPAGEQDAGRQQPEQPGPGPQQDTESFLKRSLRSWNVVFLLVFAVVGVVTLFGDQSARETALALGALAVIVVAYLAFGRRELLIERNTSLWLLAVYLLMFYALALLVMHLSIIGSLLFFVAFTNTWMMLPVRWAIGASVVFTGGIVTTNVGAAGWTAEAWSSGVATGGGTAAVGIMLGLWVTGVVHESERRQCLISELERTRAELGEAQHRAGAFAERERLASEIHDTLAQGLLSIVVHSRAIDTDDPELEQRVRRIEQMAQQNLADARGLIEALQPADLREHSLPDACSRVCARFGKDTGTPVQFRTEGEPATLPANTEVVLLRATQEALTNVHKHASADAVEVVLAYSADPVSTTDPEQAATGTVRLTVTDDGVGFPASDPGATSWSASGYRAGLRGMRNRAEQIDGRVEVTSSPGTGTTIWVEVPW